MKSTGKCPATLRNSSNMKIAAPKREGPPGRPYRRSAQEALKARPPPQSPNSVRTMSILDFKITHYGRGNVDSALIPRRISIGPPADRRTDRAAGSHIF